MSLIIISACVFFHLQLLPISDHSHHLAGMPKQYFTDSLHTNVTAFIVTIPNDMQFIYCIVQFIDGGNIDGFDT